VTLSLFRTRAPLLVNHRWVWHTWANREPSKHAAMIAKAAEIGATAWDYGQADHEFADRAGF
jgi:hypothetical protein